MSSSWFQAFVPTDINTFLLKKTNPKNQPARDSGALVKFALIPNNMVDRISVPSRRPALPAWHLPVFAGKSTPSLLACWPGPQFVSLSTRSCPPSHIFSSSSSTKWRRLRCWGSSTCICLYCCLLPHWWFYVISRIWSLHLQLFDNPHHLERSLGIEGNYDFR